MLQHRLAILFYRAWANAQSITSLDKNAEDRFGKYIASFNGLNIPTTHNKGLIHEFAKRYFSGLLIKQSRSDSSTCNNCSLAISKFLSTFKLT